MHYISLILNNLIIIKMDGESMKKVNVLMVLGGLTSGGGAEMMVMNYFRNIDSNLVHIDYVVHGLSKGNFDDEILSKGSKIHRLPIFSKNPLKNIKELYRLLVRKKYDIIHVHMDTMAALPLYLAKQAKIPIRIAHSHNTSFNKDIRNLHLLFHKFSRKKIKNYATHYFACSKAAGEFLFGMDFHLKDNAKVINNAIDLQLFKYDINKRREIRKALNLNGKLAIGHIGRFATQKNHSMLIEIFREIKKLHSDSILILCGKGELEGFIRDKVLDYGLKNDVLFLGVRNDVSDILQALDIFILPSLHEGLPVIGIEAQATGLLCFMSDTITKETNFTDMNFIDLDLSPREWANQIIENYKIFNRIDRRKEAKVAGFDITHEAKKLQDFYLEQLKIADSGDGNAN